MLLPNRTQLRKPMFTLNDTWQLLGILLTLIGFAVAIVKYALNQIERRFDLQEQARAENTKHWEESFARIENKTGQGQTKEQELELKLLELKSELPLHYVRREDYVRIQTQIDAKLDAIALNMQQFYKGVNHD